MKAHPMSNHSCNEFPFGIKTCTLDEFGSVAVVSNDAIRWFKNGKLHKEGGLPAIVGRDGSKFWYKDGVEYTPSRYSTCATWLRDVWPSMLNLYQRLFLGMVGSVPLIVLYDQFLVFHFDLPALDLPASVGASLAFSLLLTLPPPQSACDHEDGGECAAGLTTPFWEELVTTILGSATLTSVVYLFTALSRLYYQT